MEDAALHHGMKTVAFDACRFELKLYGMLPIGVDRSKKWFLGLRAIQFL